MAGVLAPLLAYGATMHVNFTLMHGYIPSTPAVDMAQAFHPSLPGAIDACAAIAACAAVTFRPEDEHSAGSVHTGAWYSYKRYPPSGAALPSVWPPEAKSLHSRCWAHEPSKRPEFSEVATELAAWRTDGAQNVLKGVVKGSKKGLLEVFGFGNAMLHTSFSDTTEQRASKRMSGSRASSFGDGTQRRFSIA